jgi:ferrochelatase
MHTPLAPPTDHSSVSSGKIAVVLVNLGSPSAPTAKALRPYLKQFLSDSRVVEIPKPLWWLILNGIILNTRPKKSAAIYESIWDHQRGLSPLIAHTKDQADNLQVLLSESHAEVKVVYAMRYGEPALGETIERLHQQGYDRQLIMPLYPQYAASTTATVVDEVSNHLRTMRHQPTIRYLPPYYDHQAYISALGESVKSHFQTLDWRPQHCIASFHGIPKRYFELGDPYHCHCAKTTRLLNENLVDIDLPAWEMTFQSLFGKAEWLKPYTEPRLIELAKHGVKNVAVICPGFSADCLETLEEIAIAAKEAFVEHGGENFTLVSCLNSSDPGMQMLHDLTTQELSGWV